MYVTPVLTGSDNADIITAFGGYNHNLRISDNEFYEMSGFTSRLYPLLATRDRRGSTPFTGTHALIFHNSFGSRNGELQESFITLSDDENGEAAINFFDSTGQSVKASRSIGGDADTSVLMSQAGYAYVFPQAKRFNLLDTSTETDTRLGNITVCSVVEGATVSPPGEIRFTMEPSDADGLVGDSPRSTRTANGTNKQRALNQLIIYTSSYAVNEYGTSAFVDSSGIVTSVVVGRSETLTVPVGGFVLSGNGSSSTWLQQNVFTGNYVTKSGTAIKVYENASNAAVATTKPSNPANGARWRDSLTGTLYMYSDALGQWMSVTQNYIYLSCYAVRDAGLICEENGVVQKDNYGFNDYKPFNGFKEGDCISITGISDDCDSSYIINAIPASGGLILNGYIDKKVSINVSPENSVTLERKIPDIDYAVECNNRIWGCHFGIDGNGKVINEIYASAQGDATNFYKYEGTAMDSWTATIGTDGAFTGAAVYGGYPIFFKDNAIIRIYGTAPSSYQVATYNYRGVKPGSDRSLAICDEVLYYHSSDGVLAYTGGVPTKVDSQLGDVIYHGATAGSIRGRYYISMKDENDEPNLFVYDTSLGMWHKEDNTDVHQFCRAGDYLYMVLSDGSVISDRGDDESDISWKCETGEMGVADAYNKYIKRLVIRAILPAGSEASFSIQCDDGEFEKLGTVTGVGITPKTFSFIPRRCNRFRIRLSGRGEFRLISLYKETEEAGI